MFEILMLFAFMYAATCQFLPETSSDKTADKNGRNKSGSQKNLRRPNSGGQKGNAHQLKTKGRNRNYACAA